MDGDCFDDAYGDWEGLNIDRLVIDPSFQVRRQTDHQKVREYARAMENAGVPENLAADIVGHEKPRITYGLYSGGSVVEVMRGALNRIDYPTLQLPRSS